MKPESELERSLAKMFKIKNDDQKSVVSRMSKTSKSVIDMSVNELLSLKIPLARSSSKV